MNSSRIAAAHALIRCERGGYSQLVLDSAITKAGLDPRDSAFASALFYGALERRVTLDFVIKKYAKHPLSDEVRAVLRCALYQLLYMDNVPHSATVDEAVNSVKALRQTSAAGMVNGILRSFLRDGKKIPPTNGETQRLCVSCSCSEDVAALLIKWLGSEKAEQALLGSLGRPPVYGRVNTLRADCETVIAALKIEGIEARPTALADAIELFGDSAHTNSHTNGLFSIQDLSSQKAALALDPKAGERILDLCAAPGSKSFILAQLMKNEGDLLCCDSALPRLSLIEKGAARLGVTIITTLHNDGAIFNPDLGLFNRVLCDVPCSGLGVMRRKPELKYRTADSLSGVPQLQYKILSNAANYCMSGGVIVYSTCTLNPAENQEVVTRFLDNHPDFSPAPFHKEQYAVTNLPGEDGADGFFIAKLQKL